MRRSKRTNIFKKSDKMLDTGFNDINTIFRDSGNTILGIANKGFRTLETKHKKSKRRHRSRHSRRTRRR